ncbi:copper resistance protein CopC [Actinophytocola xinjiangensis]|uniref:Copper resistance protein CopC n=1 Tax=Actinophytocola xinjiangensis TaxID=485602 RepID=A0A7Z0WHG6_9PSEU|nr:copper resistance CopC family protein [Actinophytocola xinjiangensis]OLF06319.1 copper resistance protein CopC [Actinophytocola xinjiangensis]
MRRAAVVVVVAMLALAGFATPALAHNQLVASNPADKATVQTSPATVALTFDQPVQNGEGLNSIAITGPEGTTWTVGAPEVASNVVSAPVDALGPAGEYTIGYRILSADGHPVRGELTFTLATAGDGTPAPASTAGGEASDGSDTDGGGLPVWVWILGAVVVLGAGLTVALRIGGKPTR